MLSSGQRQNDIEFSRLLCDYRENPLAIDDSIPRFSWSMTSDHHGKTQTAFEIMVDEDLASLRSNAARSWTSGKILSGENLHIEYAGKPLTPFTRYYWKVRVYDQDDQVSGWSPIQSFETAALAAKDWQGNWIGDDRSNPESDSLRFSDDPMPLFRKEFQARKKPVMARLYISGLGYYEAYLNGKKVGDQVLDPGWTTYAKQVLYSVYDITPMIRSGMNVMGVMSGNGWWNPLPLKFFGRWDLRDYQQTGRPIVKAMILLTYADGSKQWVSTDTSWLTTPGPVLKNSVYLGEQYDARKEVSNWSAAGKVNRNWRPATIAGGPSGLLTVQQQPPIKVTKTVKPVSVIRHGQDKWLIDMGQNFAGVARLKVKGPAGAVIHLRYGETLFPDSSINLLTTAMTQIKKGGIPGGPGAPETAWQEDVYTLKGQGIEIWQPRFTFHGFRYIEITGWPGIPTLNDIEGLRMNSDVERDGEFASSNELLNRVHEAVQWTFLSNLFSVQSDCPGREKMGYGADIAATCESFIYNFNMATFYQKAISDFANDQRPGGGITEIAPFTGIADRGYGDDSGPLGWQLGYVYLQKQLYQFYGDKRILLDQYPNLQRQVSFLQSKALDNLFYWDISDHESLDPKPESFSASCFYYHHVSLAAEFAAALGFKADQKRYEGLAKAIKNAILDKYYVKKTGRFDLATQAAQSFALWYALSPDAKLSMNWLESEINRHQQHVASGIYGTKMMFDVLRQNDRNDLAFAVATRKDFPGWGYMLANGATTIWETWAYPGTVYSNNHPMFGSIDEWFYRSILGINSLDAGFRTIQIKPQPAGDLRWAKGSYRSMRGVIRSAWKEDADSFVLNLELPVNCNAEVWVPFHNRTELKQNGATIKPLEVKNDFALVKIGSGSYEFIAK